MTGMILADFQIGTEFLSGTGHWRVTDVGTRTVIAIRLDKVEIGGVVDGVRQPVRTLTWLDAEAAGCFAGPPYIVAEMVFDENDIEECRPIEQ